jgi:hypothetical protein
MMKRDPRFWLTELELSSKHERKWRDRARKVIQTYRDEQGGSDAKFNILWSNTQTQRPALYSSTPKPVVRRRHGETFGREMALGLERCLSYAQDPGGAYDFDRIGQKLILDYLLPGRMVARVKYHPIITSTLSFEMGEDGEMEMDEDDEGAFTKETKFDDELVDEEVRIYHVPWDQYRQAVVNNWDDMWWVAYGNHFLTRDEIIDQFGSEHANVPLTHISHMDDEDGAEPEEAEKRSVKRAQVWEIWDREERKIYAVIPGYNKLLIDGADDELKLRGFFPSPEPANIVETPDSLVPIPEYTLYQYQAEEINSVTRRIDNLIDAMKLSGLYPGSQKDIIKELLNSKENTLIPVEDWGAITERGGLQGMIEWIPLKEVSDAWQRLVVHRQTLIQEIFELTGISDIQRGATDPRETKGAQQLKASFASRRLLPKQQDTQRFFRDLFRIQAEIIAEHFQPETIARMAQMEMTPAFNQAVQVMRDDALRSFSIDIETDSTIAADEQMEKAGAAEFVAALSQYLGQIFPIVQAQPAAIEPLGKMLLWLTRKFRIARDAEDEVEMFLQSFSQMPAQQDKEGEAKAQAAQAEMQMKAQAQQAEIQIKQQESQAEIQRKNMETQAQIAREAQKAELENRKLLLDIAEKEAKIRLMKDEAEAKVILKTIETDAKLSSQALNKVSEKGNMNVSQIPTKRKVKFKRDDEGRITGAEME